MSEFHVQVVRVGPFHPHPNADTLNVTKVFDYTVVTKKDVLKEGDLAVYVPVDAVVPDTEDWYHLCPRDENGVPRYPVGQVPAKHRGHLKIGTYLKATSFELRHRLGTLTSNVLWASS